MRLIPGKTKVQIELFKGVTLPDMIIGIIAVGLGTLVLISSLPFRFPIIVVIGFITAMLLVRIDAEPNYVMIMNLLKHIGYRKNYERVVDDKGLEMFNDERNPEKYLDVGNVKKKDTKSSKDEKKELAEIIKRENAILKSKKATKEEKDEVWKQRALRSQEKSRKKAESKEENANRAEMDDIIPFTAIKDNVIEYAGEYYGAAIEISPVEFRFFSQYRRVTSIENGLGRVLRSLNAQYSANIVKIERPVQYDEYLDKEYEKLDELKKSYESGLLNEEELKARVEILYDRINELIKLCSEDKVLAPFYYIVLFESDKRMLETQIQSALDHLQAGEMEAKRLNTKELAVFLKYTNQIDFDEREIDNIAERDYAQWAMPDIVDIKARTVEVNHIVTHNFKIVQYPTLVDDAWLATVMSMPGTKCVVKFKPMERDKSIKNIDRSLQELRVKLMNTNVDSKVLELQEHIESLSSLLSTLQQDNETLLQVNVYVTAYDIAYTRNNKQGIQPPVSVLPKISNMKKGVKRLYSENGFRLNGMDFEQVTAFIASQVSGFDPLLKKGRGIPSNSLAAGYPWVFANVSDVGGTKLGSRDGVPVFIDFFRRDSERINSNMVIVGKSGSGKSYATKDILTNLAAEDSKIFILDPENEYTELAQNLHGKFINVGNAKYGRINPFQIITALDDDDNESSGVTGSYSTHLQFLEEFFKQVLPDCERDAMEYLNSLVDRMYTNFGITAETDLSKLTPEDYPIFDDLYDAILAEFQQTENEYIHSILRTLMNYVAKFSTGGRNANIWNGPSTITTDENFIVFNFQSLLANRNSTIANAQMLLVLKYIDNEIIKNKDYNTRYKLNRKIVVAIDEAHVFIDTKFPVALDFMFQLAKRIRKYNGMQIVITQNIKDFVGSEEIARKSTAIINACQYSLIFSLAPNDMQDLCKLYEKAGGINEMEQEQITMAVRGQAFSVLSPTSRSTFKVEVPDDIVSMFQDKEFVSNYFTGEQGEENWEDFVAESRDIRVESYIGQYEEQPEYNGEEQSGGHVTFEEISEEDLPADDIEETDSQIVFEEEQPESDIEAEPEAKTEIKTEIKTEVKPEVGSEKEDESRHVSNTERMLTELLGKFSNGMITQEIRNVIKTELQNEIDRQIEERMEELQKNMPAEEEYTSEDAAHEEVAPDDSIFEQGDDMPLFSEDDDTDMSDSDSAEEENEDTDSDFDILDFLYEQAETVEEVSDIDMMDVYGEKVLDISLEELEKYIIKHRGE